MLLIVGTVRLPPANLAAARPHMRRIIEASRAEEGCLEYGYAEDILDPGLVHIKEVWVDRSALDRHFAADHTAEWRAVWGELGIGERALRVYEVGEPRPT
jgi:quinol monooxygenase YgiN